MLDSMFTSVLGTSESVAANVTTGAFLMCCVASLVLGAVSALIYMFRHKYSRNFVLTLALLPLIVQMVITLVNGNLGAGIAVMGVFNLVRFRSIPGSAKDIGSVFFAMAIGLATGMGYLTLAVLFTVIMAVANVLYVISPFAKEDAEERELHLTVPEDIDFEGTFDGVLERYTKSYELVEVKTSNMGSLYDLAYTIKMREGAGVKSMIDELRCHNGNLKISLTPVKKARESL